jgi:hypothetical protein
MCVHVQVIGAEKFEMPPPKRGGSRSSEDHGVTEVRHNSISLYGSPADLPVHRSAHGECYPDTLGLGGSMGGGQLLVSTQPFRTLQLSDAGLLQRGMNVKVYRADERWHSGVLENVSLCGLPRCCKFAICPPLLFPGALLACLVCSQSDCLRFLADRSIVAQDKPQ